MTEWLLLAALAAQAQVADRVYWNGPILTMNASGATAEAVAVRGASILAVGARADIRKLTGPGTQVIDLGGKTLAPGFYAAHDHFPSAGDVALHQVDLNSPPIGAMRNIG